MLSGAWRRKEGIQVLGFQGVCDGVRLNHREQESCRSVWTQTCFSVIVSVAFLSPFFPPALHPRYSFTKHAAVPKQILHFAYAHHQKLMAGNAQVVTQLTLAPPTKGLMKGVAGAEKMGMQVVFKQSSCWWKQDCFNLQDRSHTELNGPRL